MKQLVIAAVGALALAGCGKVRYPTNYLLNLPPAPHSARAQAALGPVDVREFRCPEYLCEGRIVYRPSPEEVGYYEYHRWADSPRDAITQSVADAVRAQWLFKSVAVGGRATDTAYVLTGTIEKLEEVDEDRQVRAVCTISARLTDAKTGSVVWNQTASETVAVETRNVAGVVSGLSAAVRTAVDRLVASIANDLQSAQAQASRPRSLSSRTDTELP